MDTVEFTQRRKFIVKLGKLLHKYGAPAYRLETHLMNVADHLGLRSAYIISPTSMMFILWTEGHDDEYTHSARVSPGDVDLGALSRVDDVVDYVVDDDLSLLEADRMLSEIEAKKDPYHPLMTGIAFAMAGGAFAALIGNHVYDILWSALLSMIVYLVVFLSVQSRRVSNMMEPLIALVVGISATAVSVFLDSSSNIAFVCLSSLIVFIPGLALTIGLAEISARHLVSGSAKVVDALMILCKLYFGVFVGTIIGRALFGEADYTAPIAIPGWFTWLAIVALGISLVIIFRTRRRHFIWSILSGFIAFGASISAAVYLQNGLSAFFGALAVGVYANLFTRLEKAPAVIVAMPGFMFLVPGSKTFIGLDQLIAGTQYVSMEHIGQQTFVIFMSLVAGLLFANSVLSPKKSL